MLSFLARTFLLLAAAFGLGALGGRLTRPRPRARASQRLGSAPEAPQTEAAAEPETMPPETLLTAAIGGETGAEVGGSTLIADVPEPDAPHAGGASSLRIEGEAPSSATADDAAPLEPVAAFSSYGGSGVSAGVERVLGGTGGAPSPAPALSRSQWSEPSPATDAGKGLTVVEDGPAAFASGGGAAPGRGTPIVEDDVPAPSSQDAIVPSVSAAAVPAETVPELRPDPATSGRTPVLDAPRGGAPDNLTRLSGIGPSIERLLFENGVFHFDQIAAWTEADALWADTLTGFRGRVVREKWVEQARGFAAEAASGGAIGPRI